MQTFDYLLSAEAQALAQAQAKAQTQTQAKTHAWAGYTHELIVLIMFILTYKWAYLTITKYKPSDTAGVPISHYYSAEGALWGLGNFGIYFYFGYKGSNKASYCQICLFLPIFEGLWKSKKKCAWKNVQ